MYNYKKVEIYDDDEADFAAVKIAASYKQGRIMLTDMHEEKRDLIAEAKAQYEAKRKKYGG